jgi:NADH:ubiquinone oxidoreductase subunit 6 (subunit J)
MLQIITYLLAVYLIVKGVEVLQIGLASNREKRGGLIIIGAITLGVCVAAAVIFVSMQDDQAKSIQASIPTSSQFGNP